MNSEKLVRSSAPFIFQKNATAAIMTDVIIALIPVSAAAVYIYGFSALILLLFCVFSCVILEALMRKILNRQQTVSDLSAVVTGMILALNMPPSMGLAKAFCGCVTAIVIVKQLFGGTGRNIVNPALAGVAVMSLCYPASMNTWTADPRMCTATLEWTVQETLAANTPLDIFGVGWSLPTAKEMLFYFMPGNMGNVCAVCVIAGGIYLIIRKRISSLLPLCCLLGTAAGCLFSGYDPLFHICAGNVLLCAFFMANDYTTSPVTKSGKAVFGFLTGFLIMMLRAFSLHKDGTMYALMFMELTVPLIDRITEPRPFAGRKGV